MRKLLLALALGFSALIPGAQAQAPVVGPGQPILCNAAATLAPGPTSSTRIITGATGKSIYICGWHVTNTGAAGTFAITSGSGSNCGTSTVTIIPATNVTSSAPSADHIDFADLQVGNPFLATPLDLCVTPSVATFSFVIWFVQF